MVNAPLFAVRAVSDRQCANRNSFWNGTFTRSAPGAHPQATP